MSIGIIDKFNNAKCITKQILTAQDTFNLIHDKVFEDHPMEAYTYELLDVQIMKNLNEENKMTFICIPDDITGVPWQF